ncbi:helix-turn-helix domain-containing protein [Staphylococcus haemolyticus]|uniref:helix-turn-helix domain-containing protein n=1 Tax=Staphylococcus haemolyticus TaxID=1283 RepID=UPI001F0A9E18|nr:helix-turn-helix transcriptional regulator [Staphylococcus haemolyticus]MCH4436504.1 helix-turn-helix domain-containing protein [Staphylococcus haemolyticus]
MDKVEVGKRIRKIRSHLGLTMDQFGEKIDKESPVKSGVVSNWENGKQLPNKKRLKKISELGNISLDELLYGSMYNYIVKNINIDYDKLNIPKEEGTYQKSLIVTMMMNDIQTKENRRMIESSINEENYVPLTYSQFLEKVEIELPKKLNSIIEKGKIAIQELKKKDKEILKNHSDLNIVSKILNNEYVTFNDILLEHFFIEVFSLENYTFEQEIYVDKMDQIKSILLRYFTEKYINNDLSNTLTIEQLEKLKEDSLYMSEILEYDPFFKDNEKVNEDLIKIFNNKIPRHLNKKIEFAKKREL